MGGRSKDISPKKTDMQTNKRHMKRCSTTDYQRHALSTLYINSSHLPIPVPVLLLSPTLTSTGLFSMSVSLCFCKNKNYNEVSPHTGQNGHHKKNLQTINAGEGMEKREHR